MNCKNCNTTLIESSDFCNVCGAKVIRNRLTIKNLFQYFGEQFFNYDNKFLKTLIVLFTKPEDVIGGYINGTRKKYVNVISYFAISLTIAGLQMYILNKFFPDVLDLSSIATKGTEAIQQKNLSFVQEYQSILLMLYVPMYAVISKIVFFNNKKFNYTEHLVIFMYILSHTTIISAVITILLAIFGFSLGTIAFAFTLPFQVIYSAYCLKRLFGLSLQGIILRTLFFFLILGITLVIFTIAFVGFLMVSGGMEEFIEAQQATIEASKN